MLLAAAALAAGAGASPVPLIIDTDAGFDVDDVGAVCIVRPTPALCHPAAALLTSPPCRATRSRTSARRISSPSATQTGS